MSGFAVVQIARRYFTAEHLLQTHGLRRELCQIAQILFGCATFVLNGCDRKRPFLSKYGNTLGASAQLYGIALAAQSQTCRGDLHRPHNEQIPTLFPLVTVVNIAVQNITVYGAVILAPLLFHMNQRPLPPAKQKVLDAGKLQVLLFCVTHAMLSMISGSRPSSESSVTL